MVNVALAFAVIEFKGSAFDLGLILAARSAPQVVGLIIGGVAADRLSRRAVMMCADLLRTITQGAIALLLLTDAAQVWSLVCLTALTGTGTAFFRPAWTGLMPMVVSDRLLQQANSLANSAQALGTLAGPVTAGALIVTVGPGWALAVDSATFGLSAAFLARLHVTRQPSLPARSMLDDLREGWDIFRRRTWLWSLTLRDAADNLLFACWNVLGPFMIAREFEGALVWGVLVGTFGAGLLVGGAIALHVKPQRPLVMVAAPAFLTALPLALLALTAPVPFLILATFASGVGTMLGLTVWHTTLQRHIPAAALSRVSAYEWFGSLAIQPLGLVIWAPIATLIGLQGALWAASVLALLATTTVLALPSVRRLPAHPPTPRASPVSG